MLVRKFPPLAELLEKGVRAIALEKVTGGSCSSASDEKAFKSARIQNSEQRQDKRGEPSTLHYPLSGYVCIWGKPPPPQPEAFVTPPSSLPTSCSPERDPGSDVATRTPSPPLHSPEPPPSLGWLPGSPHYPLYLPREQVNCITCQKSESEDMPRRHSHDMRTDGKLLRNKMCTQKNGFWL